MAALRQPWLHDLMTVLSAPTVVLSEPSGQIRARGAQGVLHADARVLSAAVLEVGGAEPAPVSAGLLGPGGALFISAARALGDTGADPTVRVERERWVGPGMVRERIRLISSAAAPVDTDLTLRIAADLAGIAEVKSGRSGAGVPMEPASGGDPGLAWGAGSLRVRLSAPGTAGLPGDGQRAAEAGAPRVLRAPGDGGGAVLRWPVRLASRGRAEVGWELAVADPAAVVVAAPAGTAPGDGPDGRPGPWAGARAAGDDPRLPRLLERSLADAAALRMVSTRAPADAFLAAGAPWFLTLFGRDSIWAARLLLPFGWQLAAGTLRALAALQGRELDPVTAEAPGKIPHELRAAGRQASGGATGLPPLYYGAIDATPLWACLLHDAWRWGMPDDEVRALLPNLAAALACMRDHGDADGDGFLEYIDASGRGLANQGWKDSGDSVRFATGRIATPPVALCEVQGYAHEAAMRGADLLDAFGQPGAAEWRAWAGRLGAAFRRAFWVADDGGGYPALALDAAKQPVDSLTSNIGHLLGTGLLTAQEERMVAARLAGPDMDSGFGLRTMSAAAGGYSPLSYHCGSVWSHDTAIAIRGLALAGHPAVAASLSDGLLEAATAFGWRLPELFSGDPRSEVPWPSPYPASCRPQAWAAAAAGALVQAVLGLSVDVPRGTVGIEPPGIQAQAGPRLRVDGLVAGSVRFSAGIDASGAGYLEGLGQRLRAVSSARSRAAGSGCPR